jgi:hypothetical protein
MPTYVMFSGLNGDRITVAEDPSQVAAGFNPGHTEPLALTKHPNGPVIYVNSARIAYWHEAPQRQGRSTRRTPVRDRRRSR